MADIVQEKLSALLKKAKEAHTQFEKIELGGQYDEQWAAWYADYLVTGDPDLLDLRDDPRLVPLRIITAREFVDTLAQRES